MVLGVEHIAIVVQIEVQQRLVEHVFIAAAVNAVSVAGLELAVHLRHRADFAVQVTHAKLPNGLAAVVSGLGADHLHAVVRDLHLHAAAQSCRGAGWGGRQFGGLCALRAALYLGL
jgi:hypothetical protein